MFRKQFPFRRRRDDEEEDEDSGSASASGDTLVPDAGVGSSARSPSPRSLLTTTTQGERMRTMSDPSGTELDGHMGDSRGLTVLYQPPGDRTADIIFVHGLGGSSRGTWTQSRDVEKFWPLQFLPLEPGIGEARILTFGYNSKFRSGAGRSQMSMLDFAKDLLYSLKFSQDASGVEDLSIGEKPIIFVVHSMGGLIVKEAYMQGQNDPNYQEIIKAVSSIIFLSTPHRGTNLAEVLNRILQVSFATSPMKFIAELASGSQVLQRLNEQFRHMAPRLQIVSFYETRPTTVMKKTQIMVLGKDSSMLGYPGEVSKPLDADHNNICKYESRDDERYKTVRDALKSLLRRTQKKTSQLSKTANQVGAENATMRFEDFLSITETSEKDYNFFRDRWTFGTCSWILGHDTFSGWFDDTHENPRVLWVHGNAASGKSILSSFVISHLTQLERPCHYFFIRFTDQKKKGLSMILRSLACQLAYSIPDYAEKLRQLEASGTDLRAADPRNIWQLLFKQTLFRSKIDQPIYCVIDGVDEADRPGSLIRLLADLNLVKVPLRFFITSRTSHEISSSFQKIAKQVHVDIIRLDGNTEDFRSYIDTEMDVAAEGSYREEVMAKLLEQARGNFLWLHLAVQEINSCHTKHAVEQALQQLPSDMEAFYGRMAASVQNQTHANKDPLGLSILGWVACACEGLTVDELIDALNNGEVLEIHRTIGDLCGGLVVVDAERNVSLLHESARTYLFREHDPDQPLSVDRKTTHNKLLKRCLQRLTDPTLRAKISRDQPPALLRYAVKYWSQHLSLGSSSDPEILRDVLKFLQSPYVLTWIYIAAKNKQLRTLVVASGYLTNVVHKLRRLEDESIMQMQAINVIEGWATDLAKIVGKFANCLIMSPDAIHKHIPPFCPTGSLIYQQFGRKEMKALHVSDFTTNTWDDCLARLSFEDGAMGSAILPAARCIIVLMNIKRVGYLIVYDATTFEEQRRIKHPERVLKIQVNKTGDLLVSYGYLTTRVWEVATGNCVDVIKNPPKRPQPHTLAFTEECTDVLVGNDDRLIRSFPLKQGATHWEVVAQIEEEVLDDATVNYPTCSAISPDGTLIAYGYRVHPVTLWEIETQVCLGQCNIALDETDMTIQESTFGEVYKLAWNPNPLNPELFGLNQVGLLFKWNTSDDVAEMQTMAGANELTLNQDGSLIATGDALGTFKIWQSSDLTQLYQLSAPDPILFLSFSLDGRLIYDVRGKYGNVWEPNTLARLAERAEYPDYSSDAFSEAESIAKVSLYTEHHSPRVDNVIALAGQSMGALYCYGTEDGVAALCEVGSRKLGDVERLTSFMSIEHVAWSEDGKYLAISDLSGKLSVKRVSRAEADRNLWEIHHELDLVIPPHQGHVCQLLFRPSGGQLVAATTAALHSVDLATRTEIDVKLSIDDDGSQIKWMSHPTLTDCFLGFGNANLHVFSWHDLRKVGLYMYFPPHISEPEIDPPGQLNGGRPGGRGSVKADREMVIRLVSEVGSGHVLLKLGSSLASGPIPNRYLLFDVSKVTANSEAESPDDAPAQLAYTALPPEVTARIREPLAFISRRRLMFLDTDRWICTWRIPTGVATTSSSSTGMAARVRPMLGSRGSESSIGGIEQHYPLPGDWVVGDEARLCSAMPDGTLLCPRNGDVATVQFAKLRK